MTPGSLGTTPLRAIVSAEVRLYREGLAAALPKERLALVGTASSRAETRVSARDLEPDVVIVDIGMPEAFDLIRELRADIPNVRLIAFAVDDDVTSILKCAEAGATGYVPVTGGIEDLLLVVERAADSELLCSPRVAAELFRRVGEHSHQPRLAEAPGPMLTTREHQVLTLLRQRLSNKEIAGTLNISEATVKNHVHHLLEKLRVTGRAEAAMCVPQPSARTSPA
jgi:DNA-binding NarL/FixJ family response regulator